MREIAKFKKQYKLEQDQIRAPESLVEQLYEEMQTYQSTHEEAQAETVSQNMSTPTPPEIPTIPRSIHPLLIASVCTCAIVASYFFITNNLTPMEYIEHPDLYRPGLIIDPDDTDDSDTYDVFAPDDETDDYGTDGTDDSGQTSPDDEGRLQIIIRPSPND